MGRRRELAAYSREGGAGRVKAGACLSLDASRIESSLAGSASSLHFNPQLPRRCVAAPALECAVRWRQHQSHGSGLGGGSGGSGLDPRDVLDDGVGALAAWEGRREGVGGWQGASLGCDAKRPARVEDCAMPGLDMTAGSESSVELPTPNSHPTAWPPPWSRCSPAWCTTRPGRSSEPPCAGRGGRGPCPVPGGMADAGG